MLAVTVTVVHSYILHFLFNNDVPLLFLCCSSAVPLFENTGAGSLDRILVAQVKSGEGAAAMTKKCRARVPVEDIRLKCNGTRIEHGPLCL